MRPRRPRSKSQPLVVSEVVTLPSEIDVNNAARIGHELISAFAEPSTLVIADMSLTEFCDSSGIRHLVLADKAARVRGVELRLVVRSRGVLTVMQTLGVHEVLNIYNSMTAALSGPPAPPAPSS